MPIGQATWHGAGTYRHNALTASTPSRIPPISTISMSWRRPISSSASIASIDRDPGDRAGVATHHDPAGVHVVADAPAHVVVDLEARGIREPGAEVARRAASFGRLVGTHDASSTSTAMTSDPQVSTSTVAPSSTIVVADAFLQDRSTG